MLLVCSSASSSSSSTPRISLCCFACFLFIQRRRVAAATSAVPASTSNSTIIFMVEKKKRRKETKKGKNVHRVAQPGDSRPVMPPSQRAISKQMMKKWEPWDTNTRKSNNSRMLQQLAFHTQQITKATSTQDLDPRPLANNDHPSVLPFETYAIEPGEPPSRSLHWKPLGFLSHIKRRTNSDRLPLSLWEVWFCSTLGVPIPALIGPSQQCACNSFHHDSFGDNLQTCKVKSAA